VCVCVCVCVCLNTLTLALAVYMYLTITPFPITPFSARLPMATALARRKSLIFDDNVPQGQIYGAGASSSSSGDKDKENFQPTHLAHTPSQKNRPHAHSSTGPLVAKKTPSGVVSTASTTTATASAATAATRSIGQASTRKPPNVAFQSPTTADLKARLAASSTGAGMQSRRTDREKDSTARDPFASQPSGAPKSSRKSHAPQPSTVKKRAAVVAAMTSTELTDTCKENVAALLKLKVAKTLEFVRKEMDLIRRLELDVAMSKRSGVGGLGDLGYSAPGNGHGPGNSSSDIYTGVGDGMGEFPQDQSPPMPLPPSPHNHTHRDAASKKLSDEAMISDLMALSAQHVQLCRNMEDRFNTAILNTTDLSNML